MLFYNFASVYKINKKKVHGGFLSQIGKEQTFFMAKFLIKYSIVYFFSSMSTIKNISTNYVIKRIITKLTGKQFYCGTILFIPFT